MRFRRSLGLAVAVLSLACAASAARSPPVELGRASQAPMPVIWRTGAVTDVAHIIPDDLEARLATRLDRLERTTRHEMVVVTVPTLAGHDVADVADHLGNSWRVGRAGDADGIVLLVAPNERKVRIATGDDIRRSLPDKACAQIIETAIVPRFRAGNLPGGIEAGTDALIAALD